jgi:hypothetical protein
VEKGQYLINDTGRTGYTHAESNKIPISQQLQIAAHNGLNAIQDIIKLVEKIRKCWWTLA